MSDSTDSRFSSEFFAGNRQRLRNLFQGTAPIVITAHGLLQQSTDATFPFKQDGNFWYLTGITEPDVILVMDKEKEYLILPDQSQAQQDFYGTHDYEAFTKRSGVPIVLDQKTGWKQLNSRLKKVKHVATLSPPPTYIDVFNFYTNPARAVLLSKIKAANEKVELLDLRKHFGVMRMIKQPPELDAIKGAIDITVKTLNSVRKKLPKYQFEYQVEADITHGFRSRGAAGHAFDPIVAGGANAAIVHHMVNNSPLGDKELLLLDVGAEVDDYAADISRTYARYPATSRQQKVYNTVREVQDYAFSLIKPGVIRAEYEKQVEQFMGEKLRSLGLIRNVEREEIRRYFPHATSHFLGFDVHDVGDYDRPFEAGIVMTVEPGICIKEESIGVRIEDDILITNKGIQILTKKLPRDL